MEIKEGKYTLETFAKEYNLVRQSAINFLSKLKKSGHVKVSGGGRQKRIYTISKLPKHEENGFYFVVNKYAKDKLVPKFEHYVHGNYSIERAIIDGLGISDIRTRQATMRLFNHIKSWKDLFDLAKRKNREKEVIGLYKEARKTVKCRTMPKRYLK